MRRNRENSAAVQRAHALEHILAGLVRKYGDDGRRAISEEETIVGHYTLRVSQSEYGGILIELLDGCGDCDMG